MVTGGHTIGWEGPGEFNGHWRSYNRSGRSRRVKWSQEVIQ